jgi:hypothetical protein
MKKTETKSQQTQPTEKKPYVAPKVTTHGDAAKLTKCYVPPSTPECHSHLPSIPSCPKPSKHGGHD